MTDREKIADLVTDILDFLDWDNAYDVADHLIANGVTVQKWIPVSERLPQEDEPKTTTCDIVQILLDDNTVTVGWYSRGEEKWYIVEGDDDCFSSLKFGSDFIVAWKPLSQPPKGE